MTFGITGAHQSVTTDLVEQSDTRLVIQGSAVGPGIKSMREVREVEAVRDTTRFTLTIAMDFTGLFAKVPTRLLLKKLQTRADSRVDAARDFIEKSSR